MPDDYDVYDDDMEQYERQALAEDARLDAQSDMKDINEMVDRVFFVHAIHADDIHEPEPKSVIDRLLDGDD